jgi:hypothetical protein
MTVTTVVRPAAQEYFEYYGRYISKVPDGDILEGLAKQHEASQRLLSPLSDAEALKRYAPEKWSVKEVVGHLTDAERVFSYRALRFGRADRTALPGFEENDYVPAGRFDSQPFPALLQAFADVRRATLSLYRGFDADAYGRMGEASGHPVSVRALLYIIAGHELHHLEILRDRYGIR